MREVIRFLLIALVLSTTAIACVESSDDSIDDVDLQPAQADAEPAQSNAEQDANAEQDEGTRDADEDEVSSPPEAVVETPADGADQPVAGQNDAGQNDAGEEPSISLLAGKQPNHPAAWLAHAAANESECSHSSCPYTIEETTTQPEDIPPFERAQECMLTGGVAVGDDTDDTDYTATAEAGGALASFETEVTSGQDFVELALSGDAVAEVPTAGGVRSDAGATLYADETALVLDIANPTGQPVELEVTWELSGQPERGEASWQGSLWYTDSASRLDECYVAPDYQYDRVFDVFQDVGGQVRGESSGTVRLPIAQRPSDQQPSEEDSERVQVGLRLNVGAHAVGREGTRPELAQSSASQVEGTVRFRVVPVQEL